MARLEIRLLGNARVEWMPAGNAVRLGRQGEALLAYLALNRDRAQRRELLADLLWPDDTDTAHRLSTALWRLKRALAAPEECGAALTESQGVVGIHASFPVWLDFVELENVVADVCGTEPAAAPREFAANLDAALAHYRGILLPSCDAEWVLPERQRFERIFCTGLKWLLDHHRAAGRLQTCIGAAERLLREDPLREDVHCELMRLFTEAGHRQSAIRQYRKCRDLLASELGVLPAEETEVVYRGVVGACTTRERTTCETDAAVELLGSVRANLDELGQKLERLQRMVQDLRARQGDGPPRERTRLPTSWAGK
jgi:DNA-binding SARP family transcriptional activator